MSNVGTPTDWTNGIGVGDFVRHRDGRIARVLSLEEKYHGSYEYKGGRYHFTPNTNRPTWSQVKTIVIVTSDLKDASQLKRRKLSAMARSFTKIAPTELIDRLNEIVKLIEREKDKPV